MAVHWLKQNLLPSRQLHFHVQAYFNVIIKQGSQGPIFEINDYLTERLPKPMPSPWLNTVKNDAFFMLLKRLFVPLIHSFQRTRS